MRSRWLLLAVAGCGFHIGPAATTGDDAPPDALGDGADRDAVQDGPVLAVACAQLALGSDHTCALRRSNGSVYCWGQNAFGELGGGSATAAVNLPLPAVDLSGRAYTTCAAATDGTVRCWGYNDNGQIGDTTIGGTRGPTLVQGMAGAVQLAAGRSHVCARRSDGSLRCWGSNSSGQLGDGTFTSQLSAITDVSGLTGTARVAAGGSHTCAHATDGRGWCWGDNTYQQLGDGTMTPRSFALAVPVQNVRRLGPASFSVPPDVGAHTCAIIDGGEVWCWGDNAFGQLGNGLTADSATPVRATGIADALELAMGRWHVCALRASGQVACWGRNYYGEVGDGTTQVRRAPVDVGLADVVTVGAGGFHTCAINAANEMFCWGLNGSGQLGDGTATTRTSPVRSLTVCP